MGAARTYVPLPFDYSPSFFHFSLLVMASKSNGEEAAASAPDEQQDQLKNEIDNLTNYLKSQEALEASANGKEKEKCLVNLTNAQLAGIKGDSAKPRVLPRSDSTPKNGWMEHCSFRFALIDSRIGAFRVFVAMLKIAWCYLLSNAPYNGGNTW